MTIEEDKLAITPTSELEAMLRDSADMIDEIKAELAHREMQQGEIERLDELLAETRPKWSEIRSFFSQVLTELRSRSDTK